MRLLYTSVIFDIGWKPNLPCADYNEILVDGRYARQLWIHDVRNAFDRPIELHMDASAGVPMTLTRQGIRFLQNNDVRPFARILFSARVDSGVILRPHIIARLDAV